MGWHLSLAWRPVRNTWSLSAGIMCPGEEVATGVGPSTASIGVRRVRPASSQPLEFSKADEAGGTCLKVLGSLQQGPEYKGGTLSFKIAF